MGRKGHGRSEIAAILKKSDDGVPIAEICSEHGISERTLYRWKASRNGGNPAAGRSLKHIEDENRRLKSVLAELMLENRSLRDELLKNRRSLTVR